MPTAVVGVGAATKGLVYRHNVAFGDARRLRGVYGQVDDVVVTPVQLATTGVGIEAVEVDVRVPWGVTPGVGRCARRAEVHFDDEGLGRAKQIVDVIRLGLQVGGRTKGGVSAGRIWLVHEVEAEHAGVTDEGLHRIREGWSNPAALPDIDQALDPGGERVDHPNAAHVSQVETIPPRGVRAAAE